MTEKNCTLLFLVKDDQILLAMKKRGFGADRYNGIGGKVDPGETVEQALVRECQEEIEVTPTKFYKVAEHDFQTQKDQSDNPWRMWVHAYVCTEWEGEPTETEEMAPEWFKVSEIPYGRMWQDDILWLPMVLAGKKVFGQFTFDDSDNMRTHDIQEIEVFPNGPTPLEA
jgi:8-oxo-dGTP diphosphatase